MGGVSGVGSGVRWMVYQGWVVVWVRYKGYGMRGRLFEIVLKYFFLLY